MLRNRMMRGAGYTRPQSSILLDTYSGAAGAYSLRKLRTAYVGSAIRVRRSSDSAEQDIGFVNGVLDTASMLTFCGAGDGFVTTWYDQSGNGRNFSQSTANLQPQIVSSGVLVQQGSKPAVDFLGTKRLSTLAVAFASAPSAFGVFAVASPGSGTSHRGIFSSNGATTGTLLLSQLGAGGTSWGTYGVSDQTSSAAFSARSILEMQSADGDSGTFYLNGASAGSFAATIGQTAAHLGGAGTQEHDGTIQEVIFYESNQAANRAAIASNINSYYSIY